MDPCPTEQSLSAYHDGELTAEQRAVISRHLEWCQACAWQLMQLKQMSAFVTSSAPDGLSQIALRRLHNKLDEVLERGLVRWAWEVSGIAAAILLVGSLWLARLSEPANVEAPVIATVAAPPWVGAQASADPVIQESANTRGGVVSGRREEQFRIESLTLVQQLKLVTQRCIDAA